MCKYCDSEKGHLKNMQVKHGDRYLRCYISNIRKRLILQSDNISNGYGRYEIRIKHCPMCGKKL